VLTRCDDDDDDDDDDRVELNTKKDEMMNDWGHL